ncbi:exodeoxyribonuclease V subunit beta [Aeromonas schubertii]
MSRTLETLRFPLFGERLIEASAGTGKTYTIAGLYLRLLLGHGPADEEGRVTAHARPLSVTEILVVTFTEAATAELRGRIRARIHEARLAFLRGQSGDPLLAQLLDEVPDHQQAARLLLAAERQMDEAAVFTIHGFCQRMLKSNAFESGALFETEFLTDDSQLKLQAVSDYWRADFYPAGESLARALRKHWKSPAELLAAINGWLDNPELEILPPVGDETLFDRHEREMARVAAVKAQWREHLDAIRAQTEGVVSRYTGKNYEGWLEKIGQWAHSDEHGYALPEPLARFARSTLLEHLKKGGDAPGLPLFDAIEALVTRPPAIDDLVLQRAAREVHRRMGRAKREAYQLSFSDLLGDLDRALASPLGERLRDRIRATYRVAMIDEFQDTDPQQYRIFRSLHGGQEETALLMIGDPKQAIYGFRGADIFTYIQARRAVSSHYTLGRNWRSSRPLVGAVNALFERARAPFIYDDDIPFLPVEAQGKSKCLTLAGAEAPALCCWWLGQGPTINKGSYQSRMANATAAEIHRLLTLARQGEASIGDAPLRAGDIAVLVRTGSEGRVMQQALSALGIASVYLSNRESVLESTEAREILLILHACLHPSDERALRAALATSLFDLDAKALDAFSRDEKLWEATVQEFSDYRRQWRRVGVLAMLCALLHRRQLAASLLAGPFGERRLTNYLHLAELLEQAAGELDGEYALLRWLAEATRDGGQAEEQVLRLESERKLVQIVTIHKSKGLEYPLVFLPFICSHRESDTPLYHEESRTLLDLTRSAKALEQAERERLAEDLRLLYVALTRGVYATWLGLAPVRSGAGKSSKTDLHKTAIGYLLQRGEEGEAELMAEALAALAREVPGVVVGEPSLTRPAPLVDEHGEASEPRVRRFGGRIERDWWVSSYSALSTSGSHHDRGVLATPGFDAEVARERGEEAAPERSIFTFPRGARPGTLLHTLFEEIPFALARDPASHGEVAPRVAALLERDGFDPEWGDVLTAHLAAVLGTELLPGLRLGEVAHHQAELEFFLPMGRVTAEGLDAVRRAHDPLSARGKPLGFQSVQGMLKGFIDLVFEWQGRWFVLDYKSNWLGNSPLDYAGAALEQAMLDHHYDLQYQLYTLALHRLLAHRLPDYDPARHLGGVFYLFLRGMPEAGVFHAAPSLALVRALDSLFAGEEAA